MSRSLVTGGTGLLGSHIAEQLVARGETVRALVRPGSRTEFLQSLGVELVEGDLTDPESCDKAMQGVEVVYHAAAKVGDWGRWEEFQRGCLDATHHLAEAAIRRKVRRFVHISSTSAYGHPRDGSPPVDESAPMGQGIWRLWDYYTLSKVLCEKDLWNLVADRGLNLTVIRPSWLYGERDRTTVARLYRKLRAGKVPLIGKGDNPISAIYAGDVAGAAILAADSARAAGQAYNITDQGPITQHDYFQLWAAACGGPPIRKRRRYGQVFRTAFALEAAWRLTRQPRPPLITRYATWLMGRYLSYSTAKARSELNWSPAMGYAESIERAVRWYENAKSNKAPLQAIGS
jgi:nucleoside-diphosphate-sugar epimerase